MGFTEAEDLFRAFAAEPMPHEPRRRLGQNWCLMTGDMVAVRVTDEYIPRLGPMRIEPESQAGQVDAALMIFECKRRHVVRLTGLKRKSTQPR